jgi:hypothetical protein
MVRYRVENDMFGLWLLSIVVPGRGRCCSSSSQQFLHFELMQNADDTDGMYISSIYALHIPEISAVMMSNELVANCFILISIIGDVALCPLQFRCGCLPFGVSGKSTG